MANFLDNLTETMFLNKIKIAIASIIICCFQVTHAHMHDLPDPVPMPPEVVSIEDAIDNILTAFSSGDVAIISKNLNNSVEIATPTGDGVYSKAQSIKVLQRFFTLNKPEKCEIIHQGNSNSGSQFVVLSYASAKENFRITLFLKQVNSEILIQEIDIVKQL
jgi:hypothetical protein